MGLSDRDQSTHQVVCEVEAAIVPSGSEQLRIPELVRGQHQGRVNPRQCGTRKPGPDQRDEAGLLVTLGSGSQVKLRERLRRDSDCDRERLESLRYEVGAQGRESIPVVLVVEAASPIPRRDHRTGRVLVKEEICHAIPAERCAEMEPLRFPPPPDIWIRGLARHAVGSRRQQTEHPERLEVRGQRRGGTPVESQSPMGHRNLPTPPSPTHASPRAAAESPARLGGTGRSPPGVPGSAPSSFPSSRRPIRVP